MSALVTALGWTGAVTCLVAYVLVTQGRWSATSGRYQLANVLSGIMLGTVAASSGVWPSVATNLIWAAVALHAVLVILRRRRAATTVPAEQPVTPTDRPLLTAAPTPRGSLDDSIGTTPVVPTTAVGLAA